MLKAKSKSLIRKGSLAAACGAALVLMVVLASAATIVKPLPSTVPTGTDVAPADTSGVNILVPSGKSVTRESTGKPASGGAVERAISEWTPTGGGSGGGGGSPKQG